MLTLVELAKRSLAYWGLTCQNVLEVLTYGAQIRSEMLLNAGRSFVHIYKKEAGMHASGTACQPPTKSFPWKYA